MTQHWEVIGHEKIVTHLQNCVENGKINSSYLFYGPEHLGKKRVAESFIFSIFCTSKTKTRPCGHCEACAKIKKNLHPDVNWLEALEGKQNISIAQIRELIKKMRQKSFLGGYKIAIIKDAEKLSLNAVNALLKTLEEPTTNSVWILISENLENLPATILSRCQLLRFSQVATVKLTHYLEAQGLTPKLAQELGALSQGRPGIALSLFKDEKAHKQYQEKIQLMKTLLTNPPENIENFKIIEKILRSKQVTKYIDVGISYLNIQMLTANSNKKNIYHTLTRCLAAKNLLAKNVQAKLVLENLIINNKK